MLMAVPLAPVSTIVVESSRQIVAGTSTGMRTKRLVRCGEMVAVRRLG
jgi:hypothetical protein